MTLVFYRFHPTFRVFSAAGSWWNWIKNLSFPLKKPKTCTFFAVFGQFWPRPRPVWPQSPREIVQARPPKMNVPVFIDISVDEQVRLCPQKLLQNKPKIIITKCSLPDCRASHLPEEPGRRDQRGEVRQGPRRRPPQDHRQLWRRHPEGKCRALRGQIKKPTSK